MELVMKLGSNIASAIILSGVVAFLLSRLRVNRGNFHPVFIGSLILSLCGMSAYAFGGMQYIQEKIILGYIASFVMQDLNRALTILAGGIVSVVLSWLTAAYFQICSTEGNFFEQWFYLCAWIAFVIFAAVQIDAHVISLR